jgi:ribosomal protein L11 methylase PrmA
MGIVADPGSFRDPGGHVYEVDGEILRTVLDGRMSDYEFVRKTGLIDKLVQQGLLIESDEVAVSHEFGPMARRVIRHPQIPFISYPYEWSFPLLKAAALLHLDLQLEALDANVALSDASAYNVQFDGIAPVFIDLLSLRPYRDGDYWIGHQQFCEQFLNPLLLRAKFGVSHNNWYRGGLEGIASEDLVKLFRLRHFLSINSLMHLVLPTYMQRRAMKRDKQSLNIKRRPLPRNSYRAILQQLRNWIKKLVPADTGVTVWGDYERTHSYTEAEEAAKHEFVAQFCAKTQPRLLIDLGCNAGEYSETALSSGVARVIGFDADQRALERAYARAQAKSLRLLPLFQDGANPSPGQGWNGTERKSVLERSKADAVLALAFEHHLAIGRNVPLEQVLSWIVSMAPQGIIEFVPKSDPTVQRMLALREDIFDAYSGDCFLSALQSQARIQASRTVSSSGRTLYWFERG